MELEQPVPGSEGGGYPLQRITPGGPGQGTQDPKSQPPQQSIPSGSMSMGYTPNPRGGQNYYASRPHPPQRMGNGGGPRMSNIQHLNPSMPATTAVYAAAISPSSMMQQQASFIPGQGCGMLLPQMSYVSARHPGQASGNQQQNYFPTIPYGYGSSGQPIGAPYSSYPAVLFSAQSMRGHVYNPQNSAPNTVIQQQTAPQQTPTVYMDPVGGGGPQVSMTQLGSGPGSLNGAQHMMGPQAPTSMPIVSTQVPPQGQMMPGQPPKDSKSRRKFAIPIINPTTLQEIMMGNESKIVEDGGSNSTEDSSSSHLPSSTAVDDSSAIKAQQVVGEFALKIAAVACAKNSGAPTVASSGATPNLVTSPVHEDERTNGPLDAPQENDRVVEPSPIPPTPNSQSQQHLPQNQLNPPQSQPFHPPPPVATLIPTVSANSNSPTIELHRPSPPSMSSVVKQPLSASSGLPPPTPIQHTVPHPQPTAASASVHQVVNPASAATPTAPSPSVSPAQSTSPLPPAHPQQQQAQITQPSPPSQAVASVRKPQMTGPPSESAVAGPKNVDRKKEPATSPAITAEKSSSVSTTSISNKGVQQPSGQPNAMPVSTPATQAPALPVSEPPIVKPKSAFSEQISFSNIPPLITSAVKKASPPAAAPAPASAPVPANVDKGANGEAEAPVGKVLQRPKKKPNQIRKGVDKSGSVMDAFYDSSDNTTTTAPAAASPAVTPAAPVAATRPPPAARDPSPLPPPKEATPPPPAAPAPVSAASIEPSPPQTNDSVKNSKSPVQEVVQFLQKDEIENEDSSTVAENEDYSTGNDIDAMVAAKNEENTKVTEAANNNNNNITNAVTPEIVKDDEEANKENEGSTEPEENEAEPQNIKSMTIERSSAQPTLKHTYKENQWSPINRDGKKVYDREFLLQIKTSELALKKPEFSIDMEIFRDKPNDAPINNRQRSLYGSSSMSSRGDSMGGLSYQRSSNSSSNQRSGGSSKNSDRRDRGPSSRPMGNSQSGNRSMGSKPFSSYGHLTRDDPQLHKDPHGGWKRQKLLDTSEMTNEDKQIDALKRSVRGILNKLTPEKFEKLLGQIMELPIDTKQHMEEMVNLVFEKAVDEPSFSKAYADLCKCLQKKSVQIEAESTEGKSEQVPLNFRKLLLNKCQWAFEKIKLDGDDIEKRMKEIEETTDVEKKKELKLALEDAERRIRRKSVGLVRFIGELYKLQMLTPKIMQGCITTLLDRVGEEPLECLCKLMTTIGKELEKELSPKDFNNYFIQMGKLARKSANSEVSSRIRFMLQDVIELRERDWKPRRDENNPKTLDQIEKDAIRAEMESAAMSAPISSNQRKHPSDDRNRGRPSRPQENDGWQTTVSKYRSSGSSYAVTPDASKLQNLKSQADLSGILLGGHNAFSQWGGGASSKRLGSESSRSMASNSFSNQFSALSQDDRIKPLSTSSSSMGSKVMRDRDKEDSFGRLGSKPSSRESSRSRFGQSGPSPAVSLNSRNESSRSYQMDNRDSNKSRMPPFEAPELSEDEAERKAQTVYCEWCANNNVKETLMAVHESFVGPKNICLMLRSLLNKMIDGKRPARLKFAELLVVLLKENVCSSKDLVVEFVSLVEFADDMIVDIPLFWSFLGEIFAPIIAGEVFTFDDAKASLEGRSLDDKSKVLLEVFKLLLATDKTDIWAMSNAQLQDFVPEDKVESYINNNQLLFLFPNYTAPVFIMKHRDHLVNILKSDKDDAFDEACAFLNKIENSVTKKAFIEIVSMAVIKASIKDGKLVVQLLTKHEKLLHKFVDHEEELELYCLYAIKNYLVNEVALEINVLVESFENLYDHSVISVEAFKKWKSDESVEPLVAKGRLIALKALDPFYVTLAEPDDDEDEDES